MKDLARQAPGLYNVYLRPKEDGRSRKVSEPLEPLKTLQSAILKCVVAPLSTDRALRHVVHRNQVWNASTHVQQTHITKLDVRDAFPSVSDRAVESALRASGLNREAAALVARLCTHDGELPQGAPSSNALLDLVLLPLDRVINAYCRRKGYRYTRYADDLTLSGPEPLGLAERFVERQLKSENFFTNPEKTGRGGRKNPVVITGVMTGQTTKVRPRMLERTIAELKDAAETPDVATGLDSLRGSLGWIRQVNRKQAGAIVAQNVPKGTALSSALTLRKRRRRRR